MQLQQYSNKVMITSFNYCLILIHAPQYSGSFSIWVGLYNGSVVAVTGIFVLHGRPNKMAQWAKFGSW